MFSWKLANMQIFFPWHTFLIPTRQYPINWPSKNITSRAKVLSPSDDYIQYWKTIASLVLSLSAKNRYAPTKAWPIWKSEDKLFYKFHWIHLQYISPNKIRAISSYSMHDITRNTIRKMLNFRQVLAFQNSLSLAVTYNLIFASLFRFQLL